LSWFSVWLWAKAPLSTHLTLLNYLYHALEADLIPAAFFSQCTKNIWIIDTQDYSLGTVPVLVYKGFACSQLLILMGSSWLINPCVTLPKKSGAPQGPLKCSIYFMLITLLMRLKIQNLRIAIVFVNHHLPLAVARVYLFRKH